MAKQIWECWESEIDGTLTLTTPENAKALNEWGGLGKAPILRYSIESATGEEAAAIHALRQGFEPYRPQGESAPCPKCEAVIYPDASGDCWRCQV